MVRGLFMASQNMNMKDGEALNLTWVDAYV
jgi:hypothetical protein